MWRYALREGGRWALALAGALLIAVGISALSTAKGGYGPALAARMLAFLRLDFGTSALSGQSALRELAAHGPTTANLILFGALIALALGVPLGLLLGTGAVRRATAPLIQIVSAAPVFCAGLALAYAARHIGFQESSAVLHALLLPSITVGLAGTAAVQMALRRAASQAQDSPFRIGLRRMGLSAIEIERVYVVPQIFAGLLSSLGEVMLALLSAAVVSEWVFKCPGIADLFVKSIALHDWNMAALILFVFAALTATAEFIGRVGAQLLVRAAS
jgi:peptide/nickel transport system permease protein